VNEPAQDRTVVLAVVAFVGFIGLGGLAGIVFLIHSGADATALLAVSGPTTTAIGALAGILAMTRTNPPPPVQQAQAQGYQQAVADMNALGASPAAVTVVNTPEQPVPVEATD
jgi:hypothetical protein